MTEKHVAWHEAKFIILLKLQILKCFILLTATEVSYLKKKNCDAVLFYFNIYSLKIMLWNI